MRTSSSSNPSARRASNRHAHSSLEDPGGHPSFTVGVSPYDSDASIDAIVEYYYPYILRQVKRMAYLPRKLSHSADLHVDPDDIAQEVSISFWKRLRREPMKHTLCVWFAMSISMPCEGAISISSRCQ